MILKDSWYRHPSMVLIVMFWLGFEWLWLPGSSGHAIEVGFGLAWPEPWPVRWQCDKSYVLQGDKPGAPKKYWECIAVVKATAETVAMVDTVVE